MRDVGAIPIKSSNNIMAELFLNISKSRRKFKSLMGQANHFLITALIGLDYIDNNEVKCPSSFSTSWNPKDKKSSVDRTRQYILNSSLAWAIDCLDSYFSGCNQSPKLIDNDNFIRELDVKRISRSVHEKLLTFTQYVIPITHKVEFDIYKSLTGLAIQWRNNTTHSGADNKIEAEHKKILLSYTDKIKELFCNLDITQSLQSFSEHKSPTFKEVASLIRGIQRFVETVDRCLISNIDIDKYACNVIKCHCKQYNIPDQAILSLPTDKRNSKISNILKSYSFSEVATTSNSPKIEIDHIVELWAKQ